MMQKLNQELMDLGQKLGGHKPNPVKPHKSVCRSQTGDTKIKTTHKCINL